MISIRLANNSDAPKLQELFRQFIVEADWLPESSKQATDFAAVSQGEQVFVAETRSGEIAGLISVWEPESFVHTLYVVPNHQRKGVGSMLLDSLEDWLPRPWRLKCVAANRQAVSFYQGRGWKLIETSTSQDGPYFLLEK
ncbi:GNAT family N-acetyltransferase [Bremerella cremea]|nr:GNAT family N-acetyltransferase [Bremerella cremea]